MPRVAKKLKQGPEWDSNPQKVRKERRVERKARKAAVSEKTFEELTKAEKDKVLKAVAIHMGLVKDSPDA